MVLDPRDGYAGVPADAQGRTDDGRWLIDLSANLPPGGRLLPGQSTVGRTVSVVTPDRRRVDFATNIIGTNELNHAPVIATDPTTQATIGQPWQYALSATDPDGHAVFYYLLSGPTGMTLDVDTGVANWTPAPGTPVAAAGTVLGLRQPRCAVAAAFRDRRVAGQPRAELRVGAGAGRGP